MILVFGSINVDVVVPVPHLPRSGETVLGGDYALLAGGKGANQALAARRAGSAVGIAGAVGTDGFAAVALEPLRRAGVDTSLLRVARTATGCAVIMIGNAGENMIAVAPGANRLLRAADVPDDVLGPDAIVLAQMEVPWTETAALLRRAAARGARTLLNFAPASPIDPESLADIDFLVANEGEAALLSGNFAAVARRLRQGFIVTRGAAGALAVMREGTRLAVPALPVEPIDTTGCGDAFVGVLGAGLDQGYSTDLALRRASAAAGLAATARGAQAAIPERLAIEAALARLPQQ